MNPTKDLYESNQRFAFGITQLTQGVYLSFDFGRFAIFTTKQTWKLSPDGLTC